MGKLEREFDNLMIWLGWDVKVLSDKSIDCGLKVNDKSIFGSKETKKEVDKQCDKAIEEIIKNRFRVYPLTPDECYKPKNEKDGN